MCGTEQERDVFLRNIAWLRQSHGLNKREMAKRLKISTTTLNRIETGDLPPRSGVRILVNARRAFGIPMRELKSRRLWEKV